MILPGLLLILALLSSAQGQQPSLLPIANCAANMTAVDGSDSSKTICSKCIDGYFTPDDKRSCQLCNPECKTCKDMALLCTSCFTAKYLDKSESTCRSCTKNCVNCSDKETCISCEKGYYLNMTGTACHTCSISNCEICSRKGDCGLCKEGFILTMGASTKSNICVQQNMGFYVLYGVGVVVLICLMIALIWLICFCCTKRVVIYTDDSIEIQPTTVVFGEEGRL